MANGQSLLMAQFKEALAIFNDPLGQKSEDYSGLAGFYDDNITMQRVDDTTSISGRDKVIAYLNSSQLSLLPEFDLGGVEPIETPDSNNKTTATITGEGKHTDHRKPQPSKPLSVTYAFAFTRRDAEETTPWKCLLATAKINSSS